MNQICWFIKQIFFFQTQTYLIWLESNKINESWPKISPLGQFNNRNFDEPWRSIVQTSRLSSNENAIKDLEPKKKRLVWRWHGPPYPNGRRIRINPPPPSPDLHEKTYHEQTKEYCTAPLRKFQDNIINAGAPGGGGGEGWKKETEVQTVSSLTTIVFAMILLRR